MKPESIATSFEVKCQEDYSFVVSILLTSYEKIGSLDCLHPLQLVGVITLVLVLPHLVKNCSKSSKITAEITITLACRKKQMLKYTIKYHWVMLKPWAYMTSLKILGRLNGRGLYILGVEGAYKQNKKKVFWNDKVQEMD